MDNATCYKYLGCNAGFFGYDAIQHLFFGAFLLLLVVWLCKKFPAHSILQEKHWKSGLMLVAFVALFAFLWELGECAHDAYNVSILHEHLLNYRLHINALDQPSNQDTMGDMFFDVLGAFIAFFPSRSEL